jgi:acetylornithine/N-succinyldiaminopimelate aminotransferase
MSAAKASYAWDTDGKKYLDFAAGIAVASLGHAPKAVLKTLNEQGREDDDLPGILRDAAEARGLAPLVENSCFDQVFWCNSGTEAVEAALKLARKWAYDNKSKECNEIISFRKSFHGRTYGSASVMEKRHSQPFFAPYMPGVHFAELNDLESVKALISDKTCAIIVEPVQGEGGIKPADEGIHARPARALRQERHVALIFDEVQAGMGRIGYLFAYEYFGVEPDVGTHAKGLGSGFPVGCMMAKKKFGSAIVVGTHGTTYGGNPLATAVAATV